MPDIPPALKQAWIRALRRENIDSLKVVNVCVKHFRSEDVESFHKVPRGDGTFTEVPRGKLKLKDGAVPCLLPGCPSYYSSTSTTKRTRLSYESKEEQMFNQAVQLSLKSDNENTLKYTIGNLQDLKDKLTCVALPDNWLVWHNGNDSMRFIRPNLLDNTISVDIYLEVNSFLSVSAWFHGQAISTSLNSINDIRQVESILHEISSKSVTDYSNNSHSHHLPRAKKHIEMAVNELTRTDGGENNSSYLAKLQFILCQLDNTFTPKNRRRYNIVTQIMSIKTHLISPACYAYLQGLECLSLPHVHTLRKLYSSFGLENDFCAYLTQATSCFSSEEKNVIVQMDEIHVRSDIAYKGGKLFAPNLDPKDPTRTVFAIMVSSLHKKWSCISRLLPCASISAERIFPIIKSCIIDIENCGLRVQIISTDNYPLNVNLFKFFSTNGKLETRVPHPFDNSRFLFLTFDFVHILKSIRNNWLNQKNFDKTMYFPKFDDIEVDKCSYPLCVYSASFQDVRLLYNSERGSLAKLAPQLTVKACFPSSIERQNVSLVLKVINELTLSGLQIQNEARCQEYRNNTSNFVSILLTLWKIFNISTPLKGLRLNDILSTPLNLNDERFVYLTRIVFWLDAWQALPGKAGKLSKQTYTSLRHACIVLPQITNHLTSSCGFSYLLSSFLQTDPLEHHFGLYRMMAGSNYHISYLQIIETERRLKLSSILNMFAHQQDSFQSIQTFVKSFASPSTDSNDNRIDLEPFLDGIGEIFSIEYSQQILQSLAFIAGYSVHKFLRIHSCQMCTDVLTFDKEYPLEFDSDSQFKLLELTDRGKLKYPSESVLSCVITLWRILDSIENNEELSNLLVDGPSREILVELTMIYIEDDTDINLWKSNCITCDVSRWNILRKLVFTTTNCLLANKIKNHNSIVISRDIEKRKLKKFS